MICRVAGADTAHITDIVGQRRQDRVAPIAGGDGALEATAAQNVLNAKSDQCGVLAIVIERITAGDPLDDEPGGFVEAGGYVRFLVAIDSAVGLGQVPTQCIRQKARQVQHDRSSPER